MLTLLPHRIHDRLALIQGSPGSPFGVGKDGHRAPLKRDIADVADLIVERLPGSMLGDKWG
jgi:hypothetical protein